MASSDRSDQFPRWVIEQSQRTPTSVDYGKLIITADGFYSTVQPAHTKQVVETIERHFPSAKSGLSVLDASANIGGDTFTFLHNFPGRVTAIELSPETCVVLRRNAEALKLSGRCDIIQGDSVKILPGLTENFDFVYVDPPWGGSGTWQDKASMMLYLSPENSGENPVHEFVNSVLEKEIAVVLKVPPNFAQDEFESELSFETSITVETIWKPNRRSVPPRDRQGQRNRQRQGQSQGQSQSQRTPAYRLLVIKRADTASEPEELGIFARIGRGLGQNDKTALSVETKLKRFVRKNLGDPEARRMCDLVRKLMIAGESDVEVLRRLREISASAHSEDPPQSSGRAKSRTSDIAATLHKYVDGERAPTLTEYLDVGCAEGGLTSAFGVELGLSPEHTYGCDVSVASDDSDDGDLMFTFQKASAENLPYESGRFQVVSLIMALHHFADIPTALKEVRRVLAPGGLLFIREHDCCNQADRDFFDLVHYFYGSVLNQELPPEETVEMVCGYRQKHEWTETIRGSGFTFLCDQKPMVGRRQFNDMFNSYYAFYRKV